MGQRGPPEDQARTGGEGPWPSVMTMMTVIFDNCQNNFVLQQNDTVAHTRIASLRVQSWIEMHFTLEHDGLTEFSHLCQAI